MYGAPVLFFNFFFFYNNDLPALYMNSTQHIGNVARSYTRKTSTDLEWEKNQLIPRAILDTTYILFFYYCFFYEFVVLLFLFLHARAHTQKHEPKIYHTRTRFNIIISLIVAYGGFTMVQGLRDTQQFASREYERGIRQQRDESA